MTKNFRLISAVVCICMILALLTGCKDVPTESSVSTHSQLTYTLLIQSEYETAIEGIKVFVYEDASQTELVCVDQTDVDGEISFLAFESDNYVAVLNDIPVGYVAEEFYTLSNEKTVISLSSRELTPEEMENQRYSLGDKMLDFSITDCDGQSYTLSKLLTEKRAVVLNFWFINCGPCKMEFPYLQEAYEAYGDAVAFVALNPVDGTADEIRQFKEDYGLTFPLGKCDLSWQNIMEISAYPTTVILDRDGTICLVHEGMFTDSEALCNAMEYFIADEYENRIFETIEQIPATRES